MDFGNHLTGFGLEPLRMEGGKETESRKRKREDEEKTRGNENLNVSSESTREGVKVVVRTDSELGKVYSCGICGYETKRASHMSRHVLVHTGEKPFVCAQCGASYQQRSKLVKHEKTNHRTERVNLLTHGGATGDGVEGAPTPLDESPFVCTYRGCTKRLDDQGDFVSHIDKHQQIDSAKTAAEEYPCQAEGCGKVFPKRHLLNRHLCRHSRDGLRGRRTREGLPPVSLSGDNTTAVVMTAGGGRVVKPGAVNEDGVEVWVSQEIYTWEYGCGFQGEGEASITRHLHTHTEELQLHQCEYPGCTFQTVERCRLKKHYTSHFRDRPFACTHQGCSERFKYELTWVAHLKTPHNAAIVTIPSQPPPPPPLRSEIPASDVDVPNENTDIWDDDNATIPNENVEITDGDDNESPIPEADIPNENTEISDGNAETWTGHEEEWNPYDETWDSNPENMEPVAEPEPAPAQDTENTDGITGNRRKRVFYGYTASGKLRQKPMPKRYLCHLCDFRCPTPSELAIHMRTHTGEKPFACPEEGCGASFSRPDALKTHMNKHDGMYPFTCAYEGCGYKCNMQSQLRQHTRRHTGILFACTFEGCDKRYTTKRYLDTHKRKAHLEEMGLHPDDLLTCSFEGCGRKFTRRRDMDVHEEKAHMGPPTVETETVYYACTFEGCNKKYTADRSRKMHERVVHLGETDFICTFEGCGRAFECSRKLEKHKHTHEGKAAQFVCDFEACGKVYTSHGHLRNHMTKHRGKGKLVCVFGECGHVFSNKEELCAHMENMHGCRLEIKV